MINGPNFVRLLGRRHVNGLRRGVFRNFRLSGVPFPQTVVVKLLKSRQLLGSDCLLERLALGQGGLGSEMKSTIFLEKTPVKVLKLFLSIMVERVSSEEGG